jgi:hypothetical protein
LVSKFVLRNLMTKKSGNFKDILKKGVEIFEKYIKIEIRAEFFFE